MKKSKKNILCAAIDLFAEHGIQNVSIEMIAEKSGFSRANIIITSKIVRMT